MSTAFAPYNCAIIERTGDGRRVGRCWFSSPNDVCPRHGDVKEVMERYRASGLLTDEDSLPLTRPARSATINPWPEQCSMKDRASTLRKWMRSLMSSDSD